MKVRVDGVHLPDVAGEPIQALADAVTHGGQICVTVNGHVVVHGDVGRAYFCDGGFEVETVPKRPPPTSIPSSGVPRQDRPKGAE